MKTRTTRETVLEAVIAALADAEGLSTEEVADAVDQVGELAFELDSKLAEVVIASLEEEFGQQLPAPADLAPTQFATVAALVDLVAGELEEG
jgi:acyl carrier protein